VKPPLGNDDCAMSDKMRGYLRLPLTRERSRVCPHANLQAAASVTRGVGAWRCSVGGTLKTPNERPIVAAVVLVRTTGGQPCCPPLGRAPGVTVLLNHRKKCERGAAARGVARRDDGAATWSGPRRPRQTCVRP